MHASIPLRRAYPLNCSSGAAGGHSPASLRVGRGVWALFLGLTALGIVAALVYFGAAQRVLDRLRLTDTQALLFIALMILGSFITVPVLRGRVEVTVNAGGFLVPLALVVYLFLQAGSVQERVRAGIAALGTGLAVWLLTSFTDFGPHGGRTPMIDPLWLFALIGGAIAYALGRSRRAAFIAGVLGIILADLAGIVSAARAGMMASYPLGGAGVFDAVVLGGVVAVSLAEVFGEVREGLQGGPSSDRPVELREGLEGPGGSYEVLQGGDQGGDTHAGPTDEEGQDSSERSQEPF